MKTLQLNSSGTDVKVLQQDLQFLGYKISVDGDYGHGTEAVVVQFQKDNRLASDGIAGELTQQALSTLLTGSVQGIDISHQNGPIQWNTLAGDGIDFVFCKASEGAGFTDPKFSNYHAELAKAGIIIGAYHFFHFQGATAEAQAANFLKCGVDFSAQGILPPVLDIEWQIPDSLNRYIIDNRATCAALINKWLTIVAAETGITPIIYSNTVFWHDYLGNPPGFEKYPLWIAAYQKDKPLLPPGWKDYVFWQFTGNGGISSVNGDVDRDRFNGSIEALKQLANNA